MHMIISKDNDANIFYSEDAVGISVRLFHLDIKMLNMRYDVYVIAYIALK